MAHLLAWHLSGSHHQHAVGHHLSNKVSMDGWDTVNIVIIICEEDTRHKWRLMTVNYIVAAEWCQNSEEKN